VGCWGAASWFTNVSVNVGVNTYAPSEALHINGNLRIGDAVMSTPSGSAPLFGARAWVVFEPNKTSSGTAENPITSTNRFIKKSGNVSSVERVTTGVYKVTLTTAMPDTDYIVMCQSPGNLNNITNIAAPSAGDLNTSSGYTSTTTPLQPYLKTTTSFHIHTASSNNGNRYDSSTTPISVIVFG